MGIAGVMSPFVGLFIDRVGIKKIYLIGIIFLLISYFTYGVAQNWVIIVAAMAAYWIGETVSGHSCAAVCGRPRLWPPAWPYEWPMMKTGRFNEGKRWTYKRCSTALNTKKKKNTEPGWMNFWTRPTRNR